MIKNLLKRFKNSKRKTNRKLDKIKRKSKSSLKPTSIVKSKVKSKTTKTKPKKITIPQKTLNKFPPLKQPDGFLDKDTYVYRVTFRRYDKVEEDWPLVAINDKMADKQASHLAAFFGWKCLKIKKIGLLPRGKGR